MRDSLPDEVRGRLRGGISSTTGDDPGDRADPLADVVAQAAALVGIADPAMDQDRRRFLAATGR